MASRRRQRGQGGLHSYPTHHVLVRRRMATTFGLMRLATESIFEVGSIWGRP